MPLKNANICAECGGTLRAKTITHTQPWGEEIHRFEHVPAQVCEQCGQAWLSAQVSQQIDRLIKTGKPTGKVETSVYDLAVTA